MNHFRITYKDGGTFDTSANGTLAEFTAYLMQDGGVYTEENPVTGKETRREYAKIEQIFTPAEALKILENAATAAHVIIQNMRPDGQIAHDLSRAIDTARTTIKEMQP